MSFQVKVKVQELYDFLLGYWDAISDGFRWQCILPCCRYWAIAVPTYVCVALVFAIILYVAYNCTVTPALDSISTITGIFLTMITAMWLLILCLYSYERAFFIAMNFLYAEYALIIMVLFMIMLTWAVLVPQLCSGLIACWQARSQGGVGAVGRPLPGAKGPSFTLIVRAITSWISSIYEI